MLTIESGDETKPRMPAKLLPGTKFTTPTAHGASSSHRWAVSSRPTAARRLPLWTTTASRIVIPLKEMMVAPSAANSTDSMAVRQMKLLGNMLGAEIDFVILGIDSKSRSVVASRREAMMRKRQLFYFSPDANGEYRVREGRVVQARVIAVARQIHPCGDFRRGVFHHGAGSGMGLDR